MSAPTALCAALEVALNRYLRLEPSVVKECESLDGRCMELAIAPGPFSFFIEFMPGGVRVYPEPLECSPDVRVKGSLGALMGSLRVLAATDQALSLPASVEIEGDAELLDRFRKMIATVGFDPEEWLAPVLGGVPAHRLVDGIKQLFSWTQTSTRRFADHSAEYLREESYDLARARDVERWADDVDDARDTLERLEARLRRLETSTPSDVKSAAQQREPS